jgi:hypothetical protein
MADAVTSTTDRMNKLQAAMQQADAIMGLEGFERSAGMRALDEALLAGRASLQDVSAFIELQAKLVGAQSVLKQIGQGDDRRAVIEARYQEQLAQLRGMAIRMDGAVRVAFGL